MERRLAVKKMLPYSVFFPEVHRLITYALVRQFQVLQLRCVRTLLAVCAEKLTRYAVALPECRGSKMPYINLAQLHWFGEERIEGLVHVWHNKISVYDDPDIARAAFPKVFEFVRDQILLKEQDPFFLSEDDLAALTMLVMKNTDIVYKNNRWLCNDAQIARTLDCWFTVA